MDVQGQSTMYAAQFDRFLAMQAVAAAMLTKDVDE